MNPVAPIRVRPARLPDHPAIVALSARVFAPYGPYGRVVPEWLASADVEVLVAERGDGFCGTLLVAQTVRDGEPTAEILAVGVAEEHRRAGVGTALMDAALDRVSAWGGPRPHTIRLHTAADNHAAQALFRRHGFVDLGAQLGCYEGGQPIVAMGRLTPRAAARPDPSPT